MHARTRVSPPSRNPLATPPLSSRVCIHSCRIYSLWHVRVLQPLKTYQSSGTTLCLQSSTLRSATLPFSNPPRDRSSPLPGAYRMAQSFGGGWTNAVTDSIGLRSRNLSSLIDCSVIKRTSRWGRVVARRFQGVARIFVPMFWFLCFGWLMIGVSDMFRVFWSD